MSEKGGNILAIPKEQGKYAELLLAAREGDVATSLYLWKQYQLVVWTKDKIKGANLLLRRLAVEKNNPEEENSGVIDVRKRELVMEFPDFFGEYHTAQLNWIEPLGGGFYRAGITYLDKGGGCGLWVIKADKELGFLPLFNACTVPQPPKEGGDKNGKD